MTSMPECIHHVPFDTECPQCIELKKRRGELLTAIAETDAELLDASRGSGLPRLVEWHPGRFAFVNPDPEVWEESAPETKTGEGENIDAERRKVLDQLVAQAQDLKMGY
jgi:hypothetical protein